MKQFYTVVLTLLVITLHAQQQIGQDINGESEGDSSGISVSTSSDGTIVAVGSPLNNDNGLSSGHVRVFENQNGSWSQIGNTMVGEAQFDQSGGSISLSANGNTIAIGARLNSENGSISGHVRIFENQNGTWTQIGGDIDGEAEGDQFGSSVNLSSNGTVVAISSTLNGSNGMNSGQVRIFENQNNNWTQIGDSINGDEIGSFLGRDVCLSADGNIVAINFRGVDEFGFDSVRVFENQNGSWTQIGEDINGESFGTSTVGSVSLSSDGSIVTFLALDYDENFDATSSVALVYENQNGIWSQLGDTIFSEDPTDGLGTSSLTLSGDGTILVIGANANDGNGINSGHVRVYKNQNGIWTQLGQDIDGEAAGDFLGASVSLSENGNILAVGAYGNDDNGDLSGQVTVFDLFDLLSTEDYKNSEFKIYPNPVKTEFTIQLNDESILERVTIYNTLGQEVLTSREVVVNRSKLTSGTYVVEITTNQGKSFKTLIIE